MVGKSGKSTNMLYRRSFWTGKKKLEDLAVSSDKETWVEGVWELWKAKVIKAAEKGIGNKKVNEHSKGWWSRDGNPSKKRGT